MLTRGGCGGNQFVFVALMGGRASGAASRGPNVRLIILIILILLVIGALPTWPYSAGWGYYPVGGLGTILIILLILALVGVI